MNKKEINSGYDTELESIFANSDVAASFRYKAQLYGPDARTDEITTAIGYKIVVAEHFHRIGPRRNREEIKGEIFAIKSITEGSHRATFRKCTITTIPCAKTFGE